MISLGVRDLMLTLGFSTCTPIQHDCGPFRVTFVQLLFFTALVSKQKVLQLKFRAHFGVALATRRFCHFELSKEFQLDQNWQVFG